MSKTRLALVGKRDYVGQLHREQKTLKTGFESVLQLVKMVWMVHDHKHERV